MFPRGTIDAPRVTLLDRSNRYQTDPHAHTKENSPVSDAPNPAKPAVPTPHWIAVTDPSTPMMIAVNHPANHPAKHAIEIKSRHWYGVPIPRWLRVFDCRGEALTGAYMASDKAAADLGLLGHATTPVHQYVGVDSRTADEGELAGQVTRMVASARELRRGHQSCARAGNLDRGLGGQVFCLPVAICLSNFGWDVLCDRRTARTKYFL